VQLNNRQVAAARRIMAVNAYGSVGSVASLLQQSQNFKHNIGYDFGYPLTAELSFTYFYDLYKRHGLAHGLVTKTAGKTWQDHPRLLEEEARAGDETGIEAAIRQHFDDIRFWQQLQEADTRSMVGKYAGVIFQLGDGAAYDQPVKSVRGGIKGLISVLPAWEGQFEPSQWVNDPTSPNYGKPSLFRFNESAVDPENGKVRSFMVHPDRCIVWSRDGTTFGDSKYEPIYNALADWEKIRGAGGEGFWKNSKGQPVLTAAPDVDFTQLATMLGTTLDGLADALDEVMGKWSKGFDDSLVLQGMDVKTLPVALPGNPEQYMQGPLQEISAAWPMPQKVLSGMQTGERASTEDAREWAQTCMSRRTNMVIPNIMDMVRRFERWGMLPERDWYVEWPDLTAPTLDEKLSIGEKMAKINQAMFAQGEVVFTEDEIREVAGYDPATQEQLSEPMDAEDEGAAVV